MAAKNHITLVPCDVCLVDVVLTGGMTIGSQAAFGRPPALRSFPQRLSPQQSRPGYEPGPRQDHAGNPDVDTAVVGAGRSRGRTGALSRRSPAITAGLAIRFGWRFATGGPTAVEPTRLLQAGSTPKGNLPRLTSVHGGRLRTPAMHWPVAGRTKPAEDCADGRMPAGKASATATRGHRTGR